MHRWRRSRSLESNAVLGWCRIAGLTLGLALAGGVARAEPFELVTAQDVAQAQSPSPATVEPPRLRAIRTDAPQIRVLTPADPAQALRAPLRIELAFQAAAGARIVPSTFKVLYGAFRIDLTERLRRHATVTATGVLVEQALVPEGQHRLVLQIADDKGVPGEQELQIRVSASAAAAASEPAPAPRAAPLVAWVLQALASEAATQVITGEPSGLFKRLRERIGGAATPSSAAAATPAAASLTPALGYAMDRLDPTTFAVLGPVAVGGTETPSLRTGDVFVLQFSTNLPGHVRLENIDPAGKVAHLGTYAVLADQLNRIPRDRGIRLEGQPGLERIRFYFQPCLHAGPLARPADAALAGRLSPCSDGGRRLLVAAAEGGVTARALVNLDQPDTSMVFAGATEFKANDVTVMEALLRHEPRR